MAVKRDQVPKWQQEVGERIKDARIDKGFKSQKAFAEALEKYRREFFPEFKPFTKNDAEQLENGGKCIKAEHIISVSNVLDISCDYILKGYKPEDKSLVDEFGFSPKALIALRSKGFAGEVLSFFMDKNLIELLYQLMRYFEMEQVDYSGLNAREQITNLDVERLRIIESLKTWRLEYLHSKKKKKDDGGEKNE